MEVAAAVQVLHAGGHVAHQLQKGPVGVAQAVDFGGDDQVGGGG